MFALLGVEPLARVHRGLAARFQIHQLLQSVFVGDRAGKVCGANGHVKRRRDRRLPLDELQGALGFRFDLRNRPLPQPARRGAGAAGGRRRRAVHDRRQAVFNEQPVDPLYARKRSGRCGVEEVRRQLGVAEFAEQAPDVAVNRLLPDLLARAEIAAHHGPADPLVDGPGVERQQTALAVAVDDRPADGPCPGRTSPPRPRLFGSRIR